MKKICVVTGTRAEYGLLRKVLRGISDEAELSLQLVVTGTHLVKEFGYTVKEVEADGFYINQTVEMLLASDSPVGVTKSLGIAVMGFADVFARLKPDLLLVLGDRYEVFAAASAATMARIPIAHIHGGEATEGLIDEAMRHSVTKMAHLHFVAAEDYRRRVIQLGEQPERVFMVGGLGIDSIKETKLISRAELESSLQFKFLPRNLLITFHPVTLDDNSGDDQISELLSALATLKNTGLIFTAPNADAEGKSVCASIKNFCRTHSSAIFIPSLGQTRYFSCITHVDAVVGNSSSGLIEVPTFKKGTINIGDRQKGRLRATSVIDCEPTRDSIAAALKRVYSIEFQKHLSGTINPYGEGGASEAIVRYLVRLPLTKLLKKKFYDLRVP